MTIYDGILNDQKIIFLGVPSISCSKLTRLVSSILNMVGPLSFGFIKRLHPYKNLYDLEFLKIRIVYMRSLISFLYCNKKIEIL